MDSESVKKILKDTELGYDRMSQKFSETRKFFWRGLEFIKDYAKEGDRVLDFGCGNGRLVELFADKNIDYIGVDASQGLIDQAKSKYPDKALNFQKISASQDSLPFEDVFFNTAYSIAVFHHFPKEHSKKMTQELYRITKSGGYVIVTVWNIWQKKYIKNILKNWVNKLIGRSDLDWNDCHISFKNNQGEIFQRFHHAFTKRELKSIFSEAGFKAEICKVVDGRNILFLGRKN
ncbi:MAG TPA: hypothetical protein DIT25_02320 [Candidatus Moranbacteria bacterium]|nr:hypothetical protein [Candidatus Moranbacteria bacterium]